MSKPHFFYIHQLMDIWVFSTSFASVNTTTGNICIHILVWTTVFNSQLSTRFFLKVHQSWKVLLLLSEDGSPGFSHGLIWGEGTLQHPVEWKSWLPPTPPHTSMELQYLCSTTASQGWKSRLLTWFLLSWVGFTGFVFIFFCGNMRILFKSFVLVGCLFPDLLE